jgi:MFS family permease
LPFTGGIMLSAGVASSLAPRIGVRPVAIVGMLLSIAGMLLFSRMPLHGSYATDVLPGMIIGALGMGAIFMPLTLMATTGLEDEDQGLASGLFNTSQQVGGALGLAILTTIAASREHGSFSPPAIVHGGQYGFAGAACFVAGGLVVILALLRKHHVARIQAQAGDIEPAVMA